MKSLFHLVKELSPFESRFLKDYLLRNSKKNDNTMFSRLLSLMENSPVSPSDKDCSMYLYGELPSARFATLKSRFRQKIFQAVSAAALSGTRSEPDFDEELILQNRLLVLKTISKRFPSEAEVRSGMVQILRKAREKEMHRLELQCLYHLKDVCDAANLQFEEPLLEAISQSARTTNELEQANDDLNRLLKMHFQLNRSNADHYISCISDTQDKPWFRGSTSHVNLIYCRSIVRVLESISTGELQDARSQTESLMQWITRLQINEKQKKIALLSLLAAEISIRNKQYEPALTILQPLTFKLPNEWMLRLHELQFVAMLHRSLVINTPPSLHIVADPEDIRVVLYQGAYYFRLQRYKDARRVLCGQARSDVLLNGWVLHVRILRILTFFELLELKQADREMEAMRKHMTRIGSPFPREKKLLSLLRIVHSYITGKQRAPHILPRMLHQLATPGTEVSWEILSPEVFPVHQWAEQYLLQENSAKTG